jgi:hypothetical protein
MQPRIRDLKREDIPGIAEMDIINPVKVLSPGEGCCVVDARILLQSVQ